MLYIYLFSSTLTSYAVHIPVMLCTCQLRYTCTTCAVYLELTNRQLLPKMLETLKYIVASLHEFVWSLFIGNSFKTGGELFPKLPVTVFNALAIIPQGHFAALISQILFCIILYFFYLLKHCWYPVLSINTSVDNPCIPVYIFFVRLSVAKCQVIKYCSVLPSQLKHYHAISRD